MTHIVAHETSVMEREASHQRESNERGSNERGSNDRDASLGQLFSELSEDMSTLIRQEIKLAKAETQETIGQGVNSVIFMVAGGVVLYAGLIVFLIAIGAALALVMDPWLAYGIVGVAVMLIGVVLLLSGRSKLQELSLTPEKTIETLKNDAQWAKEQIS